MKRKISVAALSLVMFFSIILQPLSVQATEAEQQKKVRENGVCSYDVILPAGYETSSVRYPVIYVLPEDGYTTGSFAEKLQDAMKTDEGMDMIIVKPELKADMDIHSILEQVVAEVDGKYRTIPDSRYRTAAGAGVGGYLAYIASLTDSEEADETGSMPEEGQADVETEGATQMLSPKSEEEEADEAKGSTNIDSQPVDNTVDEVGEVKITEEAEAGEKETEETGIVKTGEETGSM